MYIYTYAYILYVKYKYFKQLNQTRKLKMYNKNR